MNAYKSGHACICCQLAPVTAYALVHTHKLIGNQAWTSHVHVVWQPSTCMNPKEMWRGCSSWTQTHPLPQEPYFTKSAFVNFANFFAPSVETLNK